MINSASGILGKGSMKLKTIRNAAIALFCAAAAAGNMLYTKAGNRELPEDLVFFEVPAATETQSEAIDINTAGPEELMLLPGIGEVRAKAIIEYRQAYGGFVSIEEITEVSGIGNVTYENIKELITTGNDTERTGQDQRTGT